jgi:CDP-diacylglycerol pyrophosphatase
MISRSNLEQQLKRIHFNARGWGKSEISELCNILMPGEELDECANGFYEAGFALLAATKDRLILVDKKPLNYLTVEDVRFDMINEFDINHRLLGAEIIISSGMKTLKFTSWNQSRLRRLLGFVQYRISEIRKQQMHHQEAQKAHLEQLNQQLQLFLAMQQHHYYQQLVNNPQLGAISPFAMLKDITGAATEHHGSGHQLSPAQLGMAAMKRVVPVISAYTRLPVLSDRRRFLPTSG